VLIITSLVLVRMVEVASFVVMGHGLIRTELPLKILQGEVFDSHSLAIKVVYCLMCDKILLRVIVMMIGVFEGIY
jgi:hypothetical protein